MVLVLSLGGADVQRVIGPFGCESLDGGARTQDDGNRYRPCQASFSQHDADPLALELVMRFLLGSDSDPFVLFGAECLPAAAWRTRKKLVEPAQAANASSPTRAA